MLAISFEFKWDSTTSKQMNLQCQNVLTTAFLQKVLEVKMKLQINQALNSDEIYVH